MSVPIVGHDDEGQVVYLGECRVHGWHGRSVCPACLKKVTEPPTGRAVRVAKPVKHLTPLNARYRPGDEIVAFGMQRRRFWTDGSKCEREGYCRMCRRPAAVRQLTRHHLIAQGWWRARGEDIAVLRNAAANIVPLCRQCHDEVESDRESRRMLRRVLTQSEIAFIIDVIGRNWLERRYPSR